MFEPSATVLTTPTVSPTKDGGGGAGLDGSDSLLSSSSTPLKDGEGGRGGGNNKRNDVPQAPPIVLTMHV